MVDQVKPTTGRMGKKPPRKGRDSPLFYRVEKFVPKKFRVIENPAEERDKLATLLVNSATYWILFCPKLFKNNLVCLEETLRAFFQASEPSSNLFVKPYNPDIINKQIGPKLQLLTKTVKRYIQTAADGWSTVCGNAGNDFDLDETFIERFPNQREDLQGVLAIRKLSTITGHMECSTIVVDKREVLDNHPTIVVDIGVDRVMYSVTAERQVLIKELNTLAEAVRAFFGVLFIGNLHYAPGTALFGQVMELFLFDRAQTSKPTDAVLEGYKAIRSEFLRKNKDVPFPPLKSTVDQKNR